MNSKSEKFDFTLNLFSNQSVPEFVRSVSLLDSENLKIKNHIRLSGNYIQVNDIPEYLDLNFDNNLLKGYKRFSVRSYQGYLLDMEQITDVNDHLKTNFSSKGRSELRRVKKRLEHCFNITYSMYFGSISDEAYEYLMEELFRLLEIRSIEKALLHNANLESKNYYKEIVKTMILEKKASLFVIYNESNPIAINLNFHSENLIYGFLTTYDIAYSKFNVGNISQLEQIDWYKNHNFKLFIFTKGDNHYKRKWCNTIYHYHHQIFTKSNNPFSYLKGFIRSNIEYSRQKLREFGIVSYYQKIKFKINKYRLSGTFTSYCSEEIPSINIPSGYNLHDYKVDEPEIRKEIYNYLFYKKLPENSIKVYKNQLNGSYIVSGNDRSLRITPSN